MNGMGRSQAKSAAAKRHGKQAHSLIHSAPPSPPGIEDPLPANWGVGMDQGSNLALCTVCGWCGWAGWSVDGVWVGRLHWALAKPAWQSV